MADKNRPFMNLDTTTPSEAIVDAHAALTEQQQEEALRRDLKSIYEHVDKCRANIVVFENAIQRERDLIEQDHRMIAFLEARR